MNDHRSRVHLLRERDALREQLHGVGGEMSYEVCAICGKWIWLDPYGPGWVHKNRGIFGADGHAAELSDTTGER